MEYLIIRMLSSFLSGVILSQTGSFIQLGTRNILASPSTLGFDGVAILWLLVFNSLCLLFNIGPETYLLISVGIPFFIFFGFIFSKALRGNKKFERIILLGITFNLLVGAIFSLWQFLFLAFNLPFPVELWFGQFRFASAEAFLVLLLVEILLLLGLYKFKNSLLLYSLGPSIYRNWNLNEQKLFRFLFIAVAIGTFSVVGLFGAFSFLALLFPILARKFWFGSFDLKGEILWGSLLNGLLLMLIDFVCYYFPIYGAEVPVGLLVTAVGAVSLIFLLWSTNQAGEMLAKPKK